MMTCYARDVFGAVRRADGAGIDAVLYVPGRVADDAADILAAGGFHVCAVLASRDGGASPGIAHDAADVSAARRHLAALLVQAVRAGAGSVVAGEPSGNASDGTARSGDRAGVRALGEIAAALRNAQDSAHAFLAADAALVLALRDRTRAVPGNAADALRAACADRGPVADVVRRTVVVPYSSGYVLPCAADGPARFVDAGGDRALVVETGYAADIAAAAGDRAAVEAVR